MKLTFRIGAEAGAGVMVTGRMLGKCFTRGGYSVLAYPEYPSLIRGGHNVFQIRISDNGACSPSTKCDVLLALNRDAIFYHKDAVGGKGVIIYDEKIDAGEFKIRNDIKKIALPIDRILSDVGASPQMANAVQIGAALAIIDYPLDIFEAVLHDEFGRKGEDIVKKNAAVAKAGYDFIKKHGMLKGVKPVSKKRKLLVGGNEALALGAVKGGMKFFAAYPMTPASSILHYLCAKERDFNIVVKQTEDEIAAMNYVVGAGFAGVRAATGTSGGGFALMTEAIGLAAESETPVVVFLAQRVGPSTGMPTWTEQGDLRFALHASQGEFLRVVLAPGDIDECFSLAAEAFNLAEKYQIPVLVVSDKFLSESFFSTSGFDENIKIERGKIAKNLPPLPPNTRFKRYEITKDGVSPRPLPGTPNGMHVSSSYEHDETGFSCELFSMRKAQVDKRARKTDYLLKDIPLPGIYGDKNADVTLVAWGSMKLPAIEALQLLKEDGIKANLVHLKCVFPLDAKKVCSLLGMAKHTIMLENNSTGQFAGMLKEYCGWEPDFLLLKYTGRPFYAEEIADEAKRLKKAGFKGEKTIRLLDKEDLEYYNTQRYGL
ncbi:2-oxoacid:acceptor oxidoreductase subunit alpha [Candidatus Micrarchaeota archaeon]|nr:2-oxoacid:acceptor oxidoreductase subunit alpha [Candidatus Micrarchaeota archaeon]